MTGKTELQIVPAVVDGSGDENAPAPIQSMAKPRLLVDVANPDRTVAELRDILSRAGDLYDRGMPVRLTYGQTLKGAVAHPVTAHEIMLLAHRHCRPYVVRNKRGTTVEVDAELPHRIATMYLEWRGEWRLPVLNGIASAPLLLEGGEIGSTCGYDSSSGMWCENVPDLNGLVPEKPTRDEAVAALRRIRETFKTFCFADAEMVDGGAGGAPVVDIDKPPGKDESAFLAALLTAVCRPSLDLAPGLLLRAASVSGAGAGKGLLARSICIVAFGREPHAVTSGATAEELEKRMAAELMAGAPVVFLDNLNNRELKSELLASAITERPARVRVLGRSEMVPLNASALVILTGNGLTVSEDLARRFITVELDPRTEDPEARSFTADIRAEVPKRRKELLADILTIWRWGRIAPGIRLGQPLGSFEPWCRWVRDPLLALDCCDPVERVVEAKERDGRRQMIAELFQTWWKHHGESPVACSALNMAVQTVVDPQRRGRQYIAAAIGRLARTRMSGFVLTAQRPAKWEPTTYALKRTGNGETHRGHRGESQPCPGPTGLNITGDKDSAALAGEAIRAGAAPMPPMPPMPPACAAQSESKGASSNAGPGANAETRESSTGMKADIEKQEV